MPSVSQPPAIPTLRPWIRRALPWASLAGGFASAWLMDRNPGRAWMVAAALATGWGLIVVSVAGDRLALARGYGESRLGRVLQFVAFVIKQSSLQMTLFFVIPFYVRASASTVPHWIFVAMLVGTALTVSWDPALAWILRRPSWALALQGFVAFAGLVAILAIFGLSNRMSLWIAIANVALVLPLFAVLTKSRDGRSRVPLALMSIFGIGLAVYLGLPRVIPAAPLHIVRMNIGDELVDKTVFVGHERFSKKPAQLVCASSIGAPRGLREELVHVWAHRGEVTDTIPLKIAGGREKGFRTWSIKQHLGSDWRGWWTCTVETGSGQVLGRRRVWLGSA